MNYTLTYTLKAKLVWENPYVTDGLVAMWDGQWNAADGIHSSTATTWRELVSGRDFAITGTHTWQDNCLQGSAGTLVTGTYGEIANAMTNGSITYEFVAHAAYDRSSNNQRFYFFANPYIWNNDAYWLSFAGNVRATNSGSSPCGSKPLASASISITPDGLKSWYDNASPYTSTGIPALIGHNPENAFYLVKQNIIYSGYFELYTARIYNRPLTDDERAANYALDKERFLIS